MGMPVLRATNRLSSEHSALSVLTVALALPGPIKVVPGPWAGLYVRQQPGAGRAGRAMRFQPLVALVDLYNNDLHFSAVSAGGIAVNASLLPGKDAAAAAAATLYRVGCDAACSATSGGMPRVCSNAFRLSGPAIACGNTAVAAAGVPAVFTDLTVDRVGVFRMHFEAAAPAARSVHSAVACAGNCAGFRDFSCEWLAHWMTFSVCSLPFTVISLPFSVLPGRPAYTELVQNVSKHNLPSKVLDIQPVSPHPPIPSNLYPGLLA